VDGLARRNRYLPRRPAVNDHTAALRFTGKRRASVDGDRLGARRGMARERAERVRERAVFDLRHRDVAEIVDEITPRIGDPADPGNEGDDAADLEPAFLNRIAADQKTGDDLQVREQVHQEVHRELQTKDSHVEREDRVDAALVGRGPRAAVAGDESAAEPAQYPDALAGVAVDRPCSSGTKTNCGRKRQNAASPSTGRYG
jgi:hypothetical protein